EREHEPERDLVARVARLEEVDDALAGLQRHAEHGAATGAGHAGLTVLLHLLLAVRLLLLHLLLGRVVALRLPVPLLRLLGLTIALRRLAVALLRCAPRRGPVPWRRAPSRSLVAHLTISPAIGAP